MANVLFWFRNDLRLHDNEALLEAAKQGNVVPVFIIDKRQYKNSHLGFKRSGKYRAQFLLESLEDLKSSLKKIGSDLIVKVGDPVSDIVEIAKAYEVSHVYCSKEVTQEETSLEFEISQELKPLDVEMEMIWGATLYHVKDLPFQVSFLPDIFTHYRKKLEKYSKVRSTFPPVQSLGKVENFKGTDVPSFKQLGFAEEVPDTIFKGGETAGKKRLKDYVWKDQLVKTYKETRNGLLGKDYSSKFSSWISLGCLSPRLIYKEVKKFEAEVVSNESTYWLIFELMWRDYFHFVSLKYGIRLFKRSGIKHAMNLKWRSNKKDFKKWCEGETGVPFIDANMKELNETGFMSNRGRQNVASFLVKDLNIEWWWGAAYFESMLIDYDVCSNWGNWNYIAGIGNDPRPNRYFNILKQASNYDPDGEFVKHWIPALRGLGGELIQQPWNHDGDLDYPKPLLDVTKWKSKV